MSITPATTLGELNTALQGYAWVMHARGDLVRCTVTDCDGISFHGEGATVAVALAQAFSLTEKKS